MFIAAVLRVPNGNPNVNEKTKEKVLKAMDKLGYTPNVFARGLGLNVMQTTGIICPDSSDPRLAGAICYLEHELRSHGYDTIPYCTGHDLDARRKYFDSPRSKWVDAIILAGSRFVEMRVKDNVYIIEAASDLPVTLVNDFLEGGNIYSTIYDSHTAAYGTAGQLLSYGRRRILYVYTSYSYSGISKLAGYKDVPKAKNITPSDESIRQCPKDIEAARELLPSLHRERLGFDAAIISDDSPAMGAIKYAYVAGISTSHGLSIIGYNSSLLVRCADPEIISTDSKVEVLCTTTINILTGVFSGVNVPSRTTIAPDSIERKTTNF